MAEATVEELVGYISANPKRKQVIEVLYKNGKETEELIAKTTRIPKGMLERTLRELTEKGIIKKQKDTYVLTENGLAAAKIVHSMS